MDYKIFLKKNSSQKDANQLKSNKIAWEKNEDY